MGAAKYGLRWQSEAATPLWLHRVRADCETESAFRPRILSGVGVSLCHRSPYWARIIAVAVIFLGAAVSQAAETEFRGRVVCLTEETNRAQRANVPAKHEHVYGFRTQNGTYYTLVRTKLSEALFMDERVRKRDLLLKGIALPKTQTLDVKHIKSIRDGVVHDLYYYCDVCAIDFVSPEECVCCRGPVELIEKPASTRR